MSERYWLVHPNGGRQLIDPNDFDVERLAQEAKLLGGRLIVERDAQAAAAAHEAATNGTFPRFEPPISALPPLFRVRFEQIYECRHNYELDINVRPTTRVLGGYYRTRSLVRVYSHDRQLGRRPLEELFDTFLHEMAHHIEYTEPDTFRAPKCGRVPGRMHSRLFWRILGDLKWRWANLQRR
jgi:hypothetical protein